MRKTLFLIIMLIVLIGCDGREARYARLDVDSSSFHEPFYVETFELSMILLRYQDADGHVELFELEESMITTSFTIEVGTQSFWVEYEGIELEIFITLMNAPLRACTVRFEAYDYVRDMFINQVQDETYYVSEAEGECRLEYLDNPWNIQGYDFSHFSHDEAFTFPLGSQITVDVYYIPHQYEVRFFDYVGELIEIIEVYYGEDLSHYVFDFPSYFQFEQWDKPLNHIHQSMDVHPLGMLAVYWITFLDYDDSVLMTIQVQHGQSAHAPYVPEREGYTHIGWDKSFDYVAGPMTIRALYEKDESVENVLDELYIDYNFTVGMYWENSPIGTYENIFKVDGVYVDAFAYDHHYYLVNENGEVYIIDRYEFDNYENWYKTEHWGESLEELLFIDLFAITDSMLSWQGAYYQLNQSYYEAVFGSSAPEVSSAQLTLEEGGLVILINYHDGTVLTMTIYDIGSTEVVLPDYIDQT